MPADDAATHWWNTPACRKTIKNVAAAVPIILVNGTAFIGQFAWTRDHVPWIVPGQVLFSVAIESVAIYLAWHAHQAMLANDSASRLRLGAYSFALVIGAMNYSHYARDWRPNALAVALGLMSALSPWLWGIHSRRASRDQLMAQDLVEPHAVRLGATRWAWHPYRASKVMFRATWVGETNPKRAIGTQWGAIVPAAAVPAAGTLPGAPVAVPIETGPVPALPAPGVPAPDVPAETEAVPALPAPPAEPGIVAAEAALAAEAIVPANSRRPPAEKITEVREWLDGLPVDKNLPSARAIARKLGDPNQRRLGRSMRDARIESEAQRAMESLTGTGRQEDPAVAPAPAPRQTRPDQPQHIAHPVSTLPGGGQ